jgi:hypothetical protein
MRVPIVLVLAAFGMAVSACAVVERSSQAPDEAAPISDEGVPAPGVVVGTGNAAPAVRRWFCRPQPWCRWGRLSGPSY